MNTAADPRTLEALDVWCGDERGANHHIGRLTRTANGCEFRYLEGVSGPAVGARLPVRAAPYAVQGVNLPPWFAGLLPEGLRMRALVRGLKTSEDDLFTLLAAVGADTVGAVAVAPFGTAPVVAEPVADLDAAHELSFDALLDASLHIDPTTGAGDRHALAGIQPKVSAGMISFPVQARRARARGFAACILKLEPADYPRLVANEHFFMTVARDVGLDVARVRLLADREGRPGLLVDRFDRGRTTGGQAIVGRTAKFAQEDACQLLDRYPADKYRVRLRDVADALEVCTAPAPERLRLLQLLAFSYLVANGDLHAKNLSVRTAGGLTRLTPGYDLLSTLPYGDDAMALPIEGRDKRWQRADLVTFGERIGVRAAATERMLTTLVERLQRRLADTTKPGLASIGFDAKRTQHLEKVIGERSRALA
ncbi:MAG: HipA domain-containing protein [Planctomycetota bacterium]